MAFSLVDKDEDIYIDDITDDLSFIGGDDVSRPADRGRDRGRPRVRPQFSETRRPYGGAARGFKNESGGADRLQCGRFQHTSRSTQGFPHYSDYALRGRPYRRHFDRGGAHHQHSNVNRFPAPSPARYSSQRRDDLQVQVAAGAAQVERVVLNVSQMRQTGERTVNTKSHSRQIGESEIQKAHVTQTDHGASFVQWQRAYGVEQTQIHQGAVGTSRLECVAPEIHQRAAPMPRLDPVMPDIPNLRPVSATPIFSQASTPNKDHVMLSSTHMSQATTPNMNHDMPSVANKLPAQAADKRHSGNAVLPLLSAQNSEPAVVVNQCTALPQTWQQARVTEHFQRAAPNLQQTQSVNDLPEQASNNVPCMWVHSDLHANMVNDFEKPYYSVDKDVTAVADPLVTKLDSGHGLLDLCMRELEKEPLTLGEDDEEIGYFSQSPTAHSCSGGVGKAACGIIPEDVSPNLPLERVPGQNTEAREDLPGSLAQSPCMEAWGKVTSEKLPRYVNSHMPVEGQVQTPTENTKAKASLTGSLSLPSWDLGELTSQKVPGTINANAATENATAGLCDGKESKQLVDIAFEPDFDTEEFWQTVEDFCKNAKIGENQNPSLNTSRTEMPTMRSHMDRSTVLNRNLAPPVHEVPTAQLIDLGDCGEATGTSRTAGLEYSHSLTSWRTSVSVDKKKEEQKGGSKNQEGKLQMDTDKIMQGSSSSTGQTRQDLISTDDKLHIQTSSGMAHPTPSAIMHAETTTKSSTKIDSSSSPFGPVPPSTQLSGGWFGADGVTAEETISRDANTAELDATGIPSFATLISLTPKTDDDNAGSHVTVDVSENITAAEYSNKNHMGSNVSLHQPTGNDASNVLSRMWRPPSCTNPLRTAAATPPLPTATTETGHLHSMSSMTQVQDASDEMSRMGGISFETEQSSPFAEEVDDITNILQATKISGDAENPSEGGGTVTRTEEMELEADEISTTATNGTTTKECSATEDSTPVMATSTPLRSQYSVVSSTSDTSLSSLQTPPTPSTPFSVPISEFFANNTVTPPIQSQAWAEMDREKRKFVNTSAFWEAVELLESSESQVIITGPPGSGKQTLARALLRRFGESFSCHIVKSVAEFRKHIGGGHDSVRSSNKQMILLEHIFGKTFFDPERWKAWEQVFDIMQQFCSRRELVLVFTIYPHILLHVRNRSLRLELFPSMCEVRMCELSEEEKKEMLTEHFRSEDLAPENFCDDISCILVIDRSGVCFPKCCQVFVKWLKMVRSNMSAAANIVSSQHSDHDTTANDVQSQHSEHVRCAETEHHSLSLLEKEHTRRSTENAFQPVGVYRDFFMCLLEEGPDRECLVAALTFLLRHGTGLTRPHSSGQSDSRLQARPVRFDLSAINEHCTTLGLSPFSPFQIQDKLKSLRPVLISEDGCKFINRYVYEAAALAIGKTHPELVIKTADWEFFIKSCILTSVEERELCASSIMYRVDLHRVLTDKMRRAEYFTLLDRIVKGLQDPDTMMVACQHSNLRTFELWDDILPRSNQKTSVPVWFDTDAEKLHFLTGTRDSIHNMNLLYWSLWSMSDFLTEFIFKTVHKLKGTFRIQDLVLAVHACCVLEGKEKTLALFLRYWEKCTKEPVAVLLSGQHSKKLTLPLLREDMCYTCDWQTITCITNENDSACHLSSSHASDHNNVDQRASQDRMNCRCADINSLPPLLLAFRCSNLPAVSVLLEKHAADMQDCHGCSPIHLAAVAGNAEIMQTLLSKDPQCSVNTAGDTPLHESCRQGHMKVSEMLLAKWPQQLNVPNNMGETPLFLAVASCDLDLVNMLIEGGAEVNIRDDRENSLLHIACRYRGNVAVVTKLLELLDDCDVRNASHDTPVHVASSRSDGDVLQALKSAGADLNGRDESGRTPLHCAANSGNRDAVTTLLKAGANAFLQDNEYKTPYECAEPDVFDIFEKYLEERTRKSAFEDEFCFEDFLTEETP